MPERFYIFDDQVRKHFAENACVCESKLGLVLAGRFNNLVYKMDQAVYDPSGVAPTITTKTTKIKDVIRYRKFYDRKKWRIRRLTPRECWRLMGWNDGQIDRVISAGVSEAQMYKQAGNGIVVPVLEQVFRPMYGV